MTLSEEAEERLGELVELQPTKNAELQERWGLDSGSEVHSYLESELGNYYYRNDNSLICATPEAEAIAGVEGATTGERVVGGSRLQQLTLDELPGPDEEPQSVVATLHDLEGSIDTSVDEVRSALHDLSDKGLVERIRKSVPTFRLALERENVSIEVNDE
jgi:hypothetical protein